MPLRILDRQLLRYLEGTGTLLRGVTRQDMASAAINLYGLRVVAAGTSYFRQLGFQSNMADRWRHLKQTSKGIGREVNRTLDELAQSLNLPALAHHPDFMQFGEGEVSEAIAALDVVDLRLDGPVDLNEVNDVLDTYIELRAPLSNNSPFVTTNVLNSLLASSLVRGDRELTSVYDPACGFGGSLIALHSEISKRQHAGRVRFYGQDTDAEAVSVAAWRLFLRGITNVELEVGDTLIEPRFLKEKELQQFDLVASVPPLYPTAAADLDKGDPFHRFRFGAVSSSRADYGFVQHVLASTVPGGRAAVTVALSALSRTGYEEGIRSRIVHADLLETVVNLPASVMATPNGCFNSSATLLFDLDKLDGARDTVFFIDGDRLARDVEGQSLMSPNILDEITQIYALKSERLDVSARATLDDIRARNYSLLPQLYIPQKPPALASKDALEARIEGLNKEVEETLGEFETALLTVRHDN